MLRRTNEAYYEVTCDAQLCGYISSETKSAPMKLLVRATDIVRALSEAARAGWHHSPTDLEQFCPQCWAARNEGKAAAPFSMLTPEQLELLAFASEECAEVIKASMKILRHGLYSDNKGALSHDNRTHLAFELGQVFAAIELLKDIGLVTSSELEQAKVEKLRTIWRYLHHHRPKEQP